VLTKTNKRWHQANVGRKIETKTFFKKDLQAVLRHACVLCSIACDLAGSSLRLAASPHGCILPGCSVCLTLFLLRLALWYPKCVCVHSLLCTQGYVHWQTLSSCCMLHPPPPTRRHSSWGWLETAALCSQHDINDSIPQ
jgi:hypothetical protein